MTARLVVLASGSGTNCEAVMAACASGKLPAAVVGVITNNADAGVIARAERFGVAVTVVEHRGRDPEVRRRADARLIEVLDGLAPDLVVLAGWMRILSAEVGARFPIINLHPALPGEFPGVRAIERAFAAWQADEIERSGVMVHWVPDEGVDVGPVVRSETVPFVSGDTLQVFADRVHQTEHRVLVDAIRDVLSQNRPG
jgi:formyltetrahydrofolate-dependent phosphoribosylglycinamide formyltransferase